MPDSLQKLWEQSSPMDNNIKSVWDSAVPVNSSALSPKETRESFKFKEAVNSYNPDDIDSSVKAEAIVKAGTGGTGQAYLGLKTQPKAHEVVKKLDEMIKDKPEENPKWWDRIFVNSVALTAGAVIGQDAYEEIMEENIYSVERGVAEREGLIREKQAWERGIEQRKILEHFDSDTVKGTPIKPVYPIENNPYLENRIKKYKTMGMDKYEAEAVARIEEQNIEDMLSLRERTFNKAVNAMGGDGAGDLAYLFRPAYDSIETIMQTFSNFGVTTTRGLVGTVSPFIAWTDFGNKLDYWANHPTLIEEAWSRLNTTRIKDLEKIESIDMVDKVAKEISIAGEKIKVEASSMALNLAVLNFATGASYAQAGDVSKGIESFAKATSNQGMKMGLWKAISTPGNYEEKAKTGIVTYLYLNTPTLAGFCGGAVTNSPTRARATAFLVDVLLNCSVTEVSSEGYSNAINEGFEKGGNDVDGYLKAIQNASVVLMSDSVYSINTLPIKLNKSIYQHDRAFNKIKKDADLKYDIIQNKVQEERTVDEQKFMKIANESRNSDGDIEPKVLMNKTIGESLQNINVKIEINAENWKPDNVKKELLDIEKNIGLNRSSIDAITETLDRPDIQIGEKITFEQQYKNAVIQKTNKTALVKAERMLTNPSERMDDIEYAGAVLRVAEIMNLRDKLNSKISDNIAKNNLKIADDQKALLNSYENEIFTIMSAARREGSERGRSLGLLASLVDREDFSISRITKRMVESKGTELNPNEKEQALAWADIFKKQSVKISESNRRMIDEDKAILKELAEMNQKEEATLSDIQRNKKYKQAEKEGKEALKALAELGYSRMYDITSTATSIPYEAAKQIGKLARAYIKQGIYDYDKLLGIMEKDLPLVSRDNILDSIGGRIKPEIKVVENTVNKVARNVKKMAKLEREIELGLNNMLNPNGKTTLKEWWKSVHKLQREFDVVLSLNEQSNREIEKQQMLQSKIDEVNAIIDGKKEKGYKKPPVFTSNETQRLKNALTDAKAVLRIQERIIQYNNILDNLKKPEFNLAEAMDKAGIGISNKQRRIIRSQELLQAKIDMEKLKREFSFQVNELKPLSAGKIVTELIDLQRNLRATGEMSYFFRQGGISLLTNPKMASKVFIKEAFPATWSQEKADAIGIAMKSSPIFHMAQRAGLEINEMGTGGSNSVEFFRGSWSRKIPGVKQITDAAERNMTIGLNGLRFAEFEKYVKSSQFASEAELRDIASVLNIATGAGRNTFGEFGREVLFSQRYTTSRFQAIIKPWWKVGSEWGYETKEGRNYALKKQARYVSSVASILLAMKGMSLATDNYINVELLDVDSPDWLKVKIGDTRFDVLSGLGQVGRLMMQAVLWGYFHTMANGEDAPDFGKRVWSFANTKKAPWLSSIQEIITREDYFGNDVEPPEIFVDTFAPIAWKDITEYAIKDKPIPLKMAVAGAEFLGMGTQDYTRNKKKRNKGVRFK